MPSATDELVARLGVPYDAAATLSALTGQPPAGAAALVGVSLAASAEAEDLLGSFHAMVRCLATAVSVHAERCVGELRGPVMWSETLSARASSLGAADLFVCATPARAYDIDENRVLVAALEAIARAGADAGSGWQRPDGDPALETAIANGAQASRFTRHPSLKGVRRARPTPREIRRTRCGKKRHIYRPALEVLARMREPLSGELVARCCDRRTLATHEVLVAVIAALERTGAPIGPLRAENGQIYAGPVQYRHAGHGREGAPAGVVVGEMLIDVPGAGGEAELADRAGRRPYALVRSVAEIESAVRRAIEMAEA